MKIQKEMIRRRIFATYIFQRGQSQIVKTCHPDNCQKLISRKIVTVSLIQHGVEKGEIYSHRKNNSSNQLGI